MAKLKRLGILFFAKLQALVFAAFGLLAGLVYAFGGLAIDISENVVGTGTALAFMAIAGMPALFGAVGFVVGALGAVAYNLLAGRFGGIGLDLVTGD
jgi:hypothetical protein